MAAVRPVGDDTFEEMVLRADGAVVLAFGAEWCPPCVKMMPVVAELAARFGDRLTFHALDVDAAPETARRCEVDTIPTFQVYTAGTLAKTIVGARPKPDLVTELKPFAS